MSNSPSSGGVQVDCLVDNVHCYGVRGDDGLLGARCDIWLVEHGGQGCRRAWKVTFDGDGWDCLGDALKDAKLWSTDRLIGRNAMVIIGEDGFAHGMVLT